MSETNKNIYPITDVFKALDKGMTFDEFKKIRYKVTGPCQTVNKVVDLMIDLGRAKVMKDTIKSTRSIKT